MSWKQVEENGPAHTVEGQCRLESLNGKARLTLAAEYGTPGLWRLLAPFARQQIANQIYPRYLRQLKEALEGQGEG